MFRQNRLISCTRVVFVHVRMGIRYTWGWDDYHKGLDRRDSSWRRRRSNWNGILCRLCAFCRWWIRCCQNCWISCRFVLGGCVILCRSRLCCLELRRGFLWLLWGLMLVLEVIGRMCWGPFGSWSYERRFMIVSCAFRTWWICRLLPPLPYGCLNNVSFSWFHLVDFWGYQFSSVYMNFH